MTPPPNPYGSCFDATAHNFLVNRDAPGLRVCHGICVANIPGQEGWTIGHAWLEFDHNGRRAVMDCVHLKFFEASEYRKSCKTSHVVEYTPDEYAQLWVEHDYPGPWDPRVKEVTIATTPQKS